MLWIVWWWDIWDIFGGGNDQWPPWDNNWRNDDHLPDKPNDNASNSNNLPQLYKNCKYVSWITFIAWSICAVLRMDGAEHEDYARKAAMVLYTTHIVSSGVLWRWILKYKE